MTLKIASADGDQVIHRRKRGKSGNSGDVELVVQDMAVHILTGGRHD